MGDERLTERTTKTDYNQSQDSVGSSTDTAVQTGNRVSTGTAQNDSTQKTVQQDFVNIGMRVSFKVKIRGGFPNTPGSGC